MNWRERMDELPVSLTEIQVQNSSSCYDLKLFFAIRIYCFLIFAHFSIQ